MALSPLDIRKTEFTRRLRGLDPDEVAAFQELVARELDVAQQEGRMRDERIRDLEGRLQHYERIELALEEALRTTRESSRQVMEAAHQKAERVQAEAEEEATRIQSEAVKENRRLRQEAQAIAVRRKEVVARLRAFLMSEMEVLAHFEGEDPVGFIKLMPGAEAPLAVSAGDAEAPSSEASVGGVLAIQEEAYPVTDAPDSFSSYASAGAEPTAYGRDVAASDISAPSDPQGLPAEFEAYFQQVQASTQGGAEQDEAYAPYFPEADGADSAGEALMHAPEPGESPVPEAPMAWASPEAVMGWPGPESDPAAPGEVQPFYEVPSTEWPMHAHEAPAQHEPAPTTFDVRTVRKDRYAIETLVGPATAPTSKPESDQSEESAHLRRLLDGLT